MMDQDQTICDVINYVDGANSYSGLPLAQRKFAVSAVIVMPVSDSLHIHHSTQWGSNIQQQQKKEFWHLDRVNIFF